MKDEKLKAEMQVLVGLNEVSQPAKIIGPVVEKKVLKLQQ